MRTFGEFALLDLWADRARAERLVQAESLAALRFELVEREGAALGWADLTFALGEETYVVAGVMFDPNALPRLDPGTLVWPRGAAFAAAAIPEVAERVVRHLDVLLRSRAVPGERAVELRPLPAFARARARGELGAAPLATALVRMAPWVYAGRAAGGGEARIDGRDAALGAAVLRRLGFRVEAAAPAEELAWYGCVTAALGARPVLGAGSRAAEAPFALALDAPPDADWSAVAIATPRPLDVALAYDPVEPRAATFWLRRPTQAARVQPRANLAPAPGHIVLVGREDLFRQPDADTDHVVALTAGLRAGGASVEIVGYGDDDAAHFADVGVLLGDLRDPAFAAALARAAARELPFITMPEPLAAHDAWHEYALELLRPWQDDDGLGPLMASLDAGTLQIGGLPRLRPTPEPTPELRAAFLRTAGVVTGPEGGPRGPLGDVMGGEKLPILPTLPVLPDDCAAPVLSSSALRYVLAHGPGQPRSGLITLAYALRELDLPLVLATTSGDDTFVRILRRAAGPHATVLVDPSAETLTALYRETTLFVDLAPRPRGSARLMRALRCGALPVLVAGSPFANLLQPFELIPRATVESVRATVERIWRSPLRVARTVALRRAADALFADGDGLGELRQLLGSIEPGLALR
jgi:hypothetical protein